MGAVLAWRLLLRRVGSLDGRAITRSLVKMYVATIPPVIFAFEIKYAVGVVLHPGFGYGLVTVLLAGGGGLLLYVLFARALRIKEMAGLLATIGGRFGGGRPGGHGDAAAAAPGRAARAPQAVAGPAHSRITVCRPGTWQLQIRTLTA